MESYRKEKGNPKGLILVCMLTFLELHRWNLPSVNLPQSISSSTSGSHVQLWQNYIQLKQEVPAGVAWEVRRTQELAPPPPMREGNDQQAQSPQSLASMRAVLMRTMATVLGGQCFNTFVPYLSSPFQEAFPEHSTFRKLDGNCLWKSPPHQTGKHCHSKIIHPENFMNLIQTFFLDVFICVPQSYIASTYIYFVF